jgi:hypothetical protein
MTILTTTLNDKKTTVLAKKSKYGIHAVTYANDTQAYKKQNELKANGINCSVIQPNFAVRFIKLN